MERLKGRRPTLRFSRRGNRAAHPRAVMARAVELGIGEATAAP